MSGTQSPPLEATNEHIPMGKSSISDEHSAVKPAEDLDQRAEYFGGERKDDTSVSADDDIASAASQAEKSAQSVTNKQQEERKGHRTK